jgi:NADH-quinone oxidoreductase subunit N
MEFQLPEYSLKMMAPEIFLFAWALVVVAFDLFIGRKSASATGYVAMLGLMIAGVLVAFTGYGRGFGEMFISQPISVFFKAIFLCAAFMAIGSSFGVFKDRITHHRGEFLALILFSTVGMMFLASSNEMLSLWIGLELTTIPLFILAAFYKDNKFSVESGIKYFVVGAFSSALLLYGLSFLYGLSGTTELVQMKINLAVIHISEGGIGLILVLALTTIVAGVGFKLGLPPFHQWLPDVYEGAPTPVAAFLSVGSKAAGLVAFAKIFILGMSAFWGLEMMPNDWGYLVGMLACAAMIYGNVVAIRQTNIKRMLGYSSIAQAGYIMIGMLVLNEHGLSSMAFYVFAYLFANMGAFAIVAAVEDKTGSCEIDTYRGLSETSPALSMTLAIFLLSLAGIPPLAGFLAKYNVFMAAISMAPHYNWLYWVVGVGLLTSVFALYYYANVIKHMYFGGDVSPHKIGLTIPGATVIILCLVGVVVFGLYPEPILSFAREIPISFGLTVR